MATETETGSICIIADANKGKEISEALTSDGGPQFKVLSDKPAITEALSGFPECGAFIVDRDFVDSVFGREGQAELMIQGLEFINHTPGRPIILLTKPIPRKIVARFFKIGCWDVLFHGEDDNPSDIAASLRDLIEDQAKREEFMRTQESAQDMGVFDQSRKLRTQFPGVTPAFFAFRRIEGQWTHEPFLFGKNLVLMFMRLEGKLAEIAIQYIEP